MIIIKYFFFILLASTSFLYGQKVTITGGIFHKGVPVPFASVYVKNTADGTVADKNGIYTLELFPKSFLLVVEAQGFRPQSKKITISTNNKQPINFEMVADILGLEEVVVSATRNRVERHSAPVVVSTLKPSLLTATQSLTIAEGLNFSPGVRVENNCQNCGFTQVRLNGLDGGYTQILLNSRPIFNSLLGVYGLEQIPTNTIERIEVVRSGGSALYGSNAIAGTVNIITKDPILNTWEIGSNLGLIGGESLDQMINFNTSNVADDLSSGITLFGTYRNRKAYDANNDGFTELVEMRNTTVGAKAFIKPTNKSRLSVNLNTIREYRRGGDRLDLAPQFTDITEALDHHTFIGGIAYEINNIERTQKFQIYSSASYTDRESYYGGLGGARTSQDSITANNAYGTTKDLAWVNGTQLSKTFKNNDVFTAGAEFNHNNTKDQILGYNRCIDQSVNTLGGYAQYEWKPSARFTAMLGTRLDHVAVNGSYAVGGIIRNVDLTQMALSPRLTLSYKLSESLRFRGGYARGFRAPQAFNEDLHISSVGGKPQFVILSANLVTEYSNAFTTSLNYVKTINLLQMDFLLEGFYTTLQNPFTLVSTGAIVEDGSILEEVRNGEGVRVYGANFEFGLSPDPKWQFQLGGTLQQSNYNAPQLLFESDGTLGEMDILIDKFIRIPNLYGYFSNTWLSSDAFTIDVTGTYTGEMNVPRVVSNTGFLTLNEVTAFFDLNLKIESHFDFNESFMVTVSGGVTNLFNSFQNDFDKGPTRDSDYIYGPDMPRTIFLGLKFGKLH